ncbi:protein NEDD1 isoform X2 [Denticeps clupeoides]|uniref:protein NEDD1 isoform X2 n=1 Tax=Denticeps clupeoides TaxID=299321 RepID=UPI0010A432D5|nr:protein NEDD1 isoform X2 [Denticeps clupeoides]
MDEVTRLVSSGDCVKIWDSASMAVVEQFNPHAASHPVAQVCWSSNNQYLVSASSLGDKLVVSSLKSSPIPVVELAEGKKQTRVSLNSTSQFLVSGGLDSTVNIWDLKTKRLHRTLKDHKEEVTCVSFNGSDGYIASGSTSGDIILHSVTTNLSSKAFGHGSDEPIHDLKYSVVKRSLLGSVSDSGSVVLWDANTQKELHAFETAHKAPTSGLAFSPANDLLFVTVGLDKKVICYDTSSKIILRSVRVEAPLTAIDFMPDGASLVVGSTQGRIYLYDLRNLNAPIKSTPAHKTSVTCLRFQSSHGRLKSSKQGSSKSSVSQLKRASMKSSSQQGGALTPTPVSQSSQDLHTGERGDGQAQTTVRSLDGFSRETEGRHTTDRLPSLDKFSSVGRNSLDIFSPVRDDYKMSNVDATIGRNGTGTDLFSREAEGQHCSVGRVGRNSLDIFSPVREDYKSHGDPSSGKKGNDLDFIPPFSSGLSQRKTPLGTQGSRCYSPLSVFQTPPPIKEEEPAPIAPSQTDTRDAKVAEKSQQSTVGTTPPLPQSTSTQSGPQYCSPEPTQRRANEVPAHLIYDSPVNGAPPTAVPGQTASASVASSLSERIVETIGAEGTGAPLTSLQISFIRNMIHDTLEDFRDACHRDIVNLQVEMVRQFYIQLNEIHGLIEKYSVNDSLVEEIEKLKEENRRLRTNY